MLYKKFDFKIKKGNAIGKIKYHLTAWQWAIKKALAFGLTLTLQVEKQL
jgi:hypothetical protein